LKSLLPQSHRLTPRNGEHPRSISQRGHSLARSFVADWRWNVHRTKRLGKNAKTIALHLSCAMDASGYCFMSYPTIADLAAMGETTVKEAVRDLRTRGWLTVGKMRVRPVLGGSVNTYQATLPDWATN
jgi:hypothetical protein